MCVRPVPRTADPDRRTRPAGEPPSVTCQPIRSQGDIPRHLCRRPVRTPPRPGEKRKQYLTDMLRWTSQSGRTRGTSLTRGSNRPLTTLRDRHRRDNTRDELPPRAGVPLAQPERRTFFARASSYFLPGDSYRELRLVPNEMMGDDWLNRIATGIDDSSPMLNLWTLGGHNCGSECATQKRR